MTDNPITIWIALYGAILSSIVLGWNLYRDLTDRGRLEVFCYIGKIFKSVGPKDDKDYLVYSVTNVGRRPIMVLHVGGERKSGQFLVLPKYLPKMLQPGEYILEYLDDLSVLNKDLISLWAIDTLGKKHKVKEKTLNKLIAKQDLPQMKGSVGS